MNLSEPLMMMLMNLSAFGIGTYLLSMGFVQLNKEVKMACSLLVILPLVMIPFTFFTNRAYFSRMGGHIATWMNGDLGVAVIGGITEGVVLGLVTAVLLSAFRPRS